MRDDVEAEISKLFNEVTKLQTEFRDQNFKDFKARTKV
jgi:hypothetical protein